MTAIHTLAYFVIIIVLLSTISHIQIYHVVNAVKHQNPTKGVTKHKIQSSHVTSSSLSSSSSSSSSFLTTSHHIPKKNNIGQEAAGTSMGSSGSSSSSSSNTKAVIINFDDGSMGQFTYAKPILDKYGFKATFFIVCNYANSGSKDYMNWQDIQQLQKDGQDIESHTMNHIDLTTLSLTDLNYEIGQSKQCLLDHGLNNNGIGVNVFAYPYGVGQDDPNIVDTVAKYYDIARSAGKPLQFLDVATTDRYSINAINIAYKTQMTTITNNNNLVDDSQALTNFINLVNSQNKYNNNNNNKNGGQINSIPIVVYHRIGYSSSDQNTTPELLDAEMKYLHDNGFSVYTMANLKYNQNNKSLYLGDIPGITAGASVG